ncbi:DUF5681 domain-containing protein [Parerythrobacter lacustris]|uniref:DUF5681 domain-containing protein n=1 Tax=Parerythrobacter lacustris TaxID=2969984 RepID=A0ABT1XQF0_9SPHN|nr:DUF5681 domain-containing protein [Parerythrobacter lacustris]MCR2833489.1 DUF5681 domain-containing protein [Parerythrobacter lacustris]
MAAQKSTEKSTKKRGNPQNLVAPWKPGQSGNPKGRRLGQRDRKTVIMEALRRIAEKKKMTPEEVEEALQAAGLDKALKGSFMHFKEISDGLYGPITNKVDLTSGGRTIADLITIANGKAKPGADATS